MMRPQELDLWGNGRHFTYTVKFFILFQLTELSEDLINKIVSQLCKVQRDILSSAKNEAHRLHLSLMLESNKYINPWSLWSHKKLINCLYIPDHRSHDNTYNSY